MTIINKKVNPEKIAFKDYDPKTKIVFKRLNVILEKLLVGFKDVQIEHVGSTSMEVPGKNIIDILIICHEDDRVSIRDKLVEIGFLKEKLKTKRSTLLVEGSIRYFFKRYNINCHIASFKMPVCKRMPYLRDYMLKHPKLRQEYADLKVEALKFGKLSNKEYNKHKSKIIHKVLGSKFL